MSCTSNVETESRSHDAIETSGEVRRRSAKKSTAVPRARAKQSALGSAQTQLKSTRRDWTSVVQKVNTTHSSKGGCSGSGLQSLFADWNLKLQLSLHPDSSSAKAVASRRGAGKSIRHIRSRMRWLQERVAAKHLRVVKVVTKSNPADM